MKRVIAILLSIVLILSHSVIAFAAVPGENSVLKFDENGEFKIFNICDIQDHFPMNETTVVFIKDMIKLHSPDLVVLGGDNTTAPKETKADAIKEICDIFVESKTYFTFVFGNHDDEQDVSREELFRMYKLYGGKYCLAYDAVPELSGVGTHNLNVKSSDGKKIAYSLYMFDSNSYVYDEDGNELGYDCVHKDQIDWYKNTSEKLKAANGGETVKAMAFQHIIVQDIYEMMFYEFPFTLGKATVNFDGQSYTYLPFVYNIKDGFLLEAPCPGYYNYGQFDAFVETGDVVAVFSGHDHLNSFTVEKDGVDIVNTPTCSFGTYGDPATRGIRMLTINEADTSVYESRMLTVTDYVLGDGEYLTELGDVTKGDAVLGIFETVFFKFYFQVADLIDLFTGIKL